MGAEAIVNSELLSFSFPLTSDTPDIKGGTLASKRKESVGCGVLRRHGAVLPRQIVASRWNLVGGM